MITEDYCSYEVVKLLKEKGFDGEIHTTFDKEGYTQPSITHQMAMKWLREIHKVVIAINAYHADHWEGYIDSFEISIYHYASTIIVPNEIIYHTDYTEAVEAALKYSLENLI